jgi:Prenyltransferase and squalene oxidase repeat
MKKLFRPLALAAAIGVGGIAGTNYLLAQEKPAKGEPPVESPVKPAVESPFRGKVEDPKPVRGGLEDPIKPGRGGDKTPGGGAAGDSKPDNSVAPVKINDTIVKTDFAVKPKELSAVVKKGLEYLIKNQQEDGGWNQGGGWRINNAGGGRIEGANVEDPSDIGNTCFALLALLRAGNTATEGQYKENVKKGLKFVITKAEKADKDSLYVTDVRGTQLQGKIGQYVDTFLVNLVLAEFRGKSGDQEKALVAALEKTMTKIVRHQTADGGFAGNNGWAPTLSVGIANKSLVRAKERGAVVDEKALQRAMAQAQGAVTNTAPVAVADPKTTPASGTGSAAGSSTGVGGGAVAGPAAPVAGKAGDAGVSLYRLGQGAGNNQDIINGLRIDAEKAKQILKDDKAPKDAKELAAKKVEAFDRADKDNDKVQRDLASNVRNEGFVAGFGSNGGEEFLSFMNISETLVLLGGKDWQDWDAKMVKGLEAAQDKEGSWQGSHCITGKTFCTAGALLVLMADRTPFPLEVIKAAKEKKDAPPANDKKPEPKPEK